MPSDRPSTIDFSEVEYHSPQKPSAYLAVACGVALCLHIHLSYLWLNWQYTITSLERTPQALAWIFVNGVTCVLYFIWLRRVSRNLQGFSIRKIKHTSKQACWWHITPFLNFIMPFIVMLEISDVSIKRKKYMEMVTTWWLSWLMFLCTIVLQFKGFKESIEYAIVYLHLVSGVLFYPALVVLAYRITAGQLRRREAFILHYSKKAEEADETSKVEIKTIGQLRERSR